MLPLLLDLGIGIVEIGLGLLALGFLVDVTPRGSNGLRRQIAERRKQRKPRKSEERADDEAAGEAS